MLYFCKIEQVMLTFIINIINKLTTVTSLVCKYLVPSIVIHFIIKHFILY